MFTEDEDIFSFDNCEVLRLVVGPLDVNCYVVWDKETLSAFIVDPGGDAGVIADEVKRRGLNIKYVINTHGHFDHIGANSEIKTITGAAVAIHGLDAPLLRTASVQSSFFGLNVVSQPEPDIALEDGEILNAGAIEVGIIHTPGHTKGGISIYIEDEGALFTGDTLFAGSIGRTDLPGGSYDDLISSINNGILTLPDDVMVFPGHGPHTTIGEERRTNPFLIPPDPSS
ncbi:MAG: MBL fold metallo-hydrolase [Thermodesulfobacteriota bacterium]